MGEGREGRAPVTGLASHSMATTSESCWQRQLGLLTCRWRFMPDPHSLHVRLHAFSVKALRRPVATRHTPAHPGISNKLLQDTCRLDTTSPHKHTVTYTQ